MATSKLHRRVKPSADNEAFNDGAINFLHKKLMAVARRETFFEEAMVSPVTSVRSPQNPCTCWALLCWLVCPTPDTLVPSTLHKQLDVFPNHCFGMLGELGP